MKLTRLRHYFNPDIFFIVLMLFGLIAALVVAGCGRPSRQEILREVIAAINEGGFTCEWSVTMPEDKRRGEELTVNARPKKCWENQ